MNLKSLQFDLDIVNQSIYFWSDLLEKTIEEIETQENRSAPDMHKVAPLYDQLKIFYKKILFEKEQLKKTEIAYDSYLRKSQKICRGHFQKSFLT